MFCTACGAANDDDGRFCTSCGSPLDHPEPTGASEPSGPTAHEPSSSGIPPVGPGGPVGPVGGGPAAGAARNRLPLIIAIVAAVVVVAGAIAAFLTYRAELWGGKALPDPASITSQVSSKQNGKSSVTAKAIADALHAKGLATTTVREFSGESRGAFLGYVGAKPGERVRADVTVTIRESAGPGVPRNVIGKRAEQTVSTLNGMGVPVHYKQIIVNDTKKMPEGTIIAAYPTAGQAVSEDGKDDGIYVGVATKGNGIGADIVGGDRDAVRSQLESKGYKVTLVPRFASKDRIGKITGSNPAPGSPVSSGAAVTLYYGIDASGVKEAYTIHNSPETGAASNMLGTSAVAAGTWCRNDGDCITFDAGAETDSAYDKGSITYQKGRDGQDYGEYGGLVSCDAIQQPYCSNDRADYLITQNYGAFELMPRESLTDYWCGERRVDTNGAGMGACVNGTLDQNSMSSTYSGATYRMQDYFVVVPVGSDLEGLEGTGFFDKDALADAKKGKAVDTDRPFLLYRDPKLYSKTSVPMTDTMAQNPFLPFNGYSGSRDAVMKMKPAPSDSSVYYLVEQGGDYDWQSLADATVKGAKTTEDADSSSTGSKQSEESAESARKTYTNDEIISAADKGDFTPIAGTYCLKSGKSCVTLDKTGALSLKSGDKPLLYEHPTKLRYRPDGWSAYTGGTTRFLDLTAPDDDYQCTTKDGATHSGAFCASDAYFSQGGDEANISQRPVNPLYIFKGSSCDIANGDTPFDPGQGVMTFSADRPCLYFMGYHMNTAPTEQTAYYLQE
ncbi:MULTISPECIES: PASTA domain-containing protein [unclassified Bifidobacterium]|uniref:PASTA domain-containing protein n=1 Tax=unclassified Bifidobacterium TaxID=2608897 RepID=UPI00112E01BB|nr:MULTISPECIES: PASTA domain-containing protein [unclassified Bifidobacterium]